jgi:ribosomal protein S12 methylthiotransferase accessory factor
LFYQTLDAVLEILLDEGLEVEDYLVNLRRMFGDERVDAAMGSAGASIRFYGLTPTSNKLEGLDRHHRMIDSYRKIHAARSRTATTT